MHQLITTNKMTMTSKEIAELVEKRHDNIKRTIETLANSGVISYPQIEDGAKSANGVIEKIYVFTGVQGKRDSIIVVAQLSPQFTARLVDRWSELESKITQLPMNPASMSRMQLLQLAMQAEEERLQLEHQVDELKPRAAVADRLDVAEGRLTIRDAAKALKMQQTKFVNWLLVNKWLYRDGKGKLRGYAEKTPRYIEHKITPIPTEDDADKVSMQAMITPAGLTRLADIFNVEAELDFDQAA